MHRLAIPLALLVAIVGTPAVAAEPTGEIVIAVDGSAAGTITLPADFEVDWFGIEVVSKSPHVSVVFAKDSALLLSMTWFHQGTGATAVGDGGPHLLPAGRSTLRVVSEGKATVRLPGRGLRGRRVVRPRGRLTGATAVRRDVDTSSTVTTDVLPFTTNGPAWVVHYLGYEANADLRLDAFCTVPDDLPCDLVPTDVDRDSEGRGGKFWWDSEWDRSGRSTARFRSVHTDDPTFVVEHWIVAIPLT